MSKGKTPSQDARAQLAAETARLLDENGYEENGDIERARRKAAEHLGHGDRARWPDDDSIAQALRERMGLLEPDNGARLERLRRIALRAMRAFAEFQPRLSGWLANDIALPHMPVELLLEADTPELVMLALMAQEIQFREAEHILYFADRSRHAAPSFRFLAGEQPIELIVLDERHQRKGAPVDRRSRKPRPRITPKALEALLDQRSEIGT